MAVGFRTTKLKVSFSYFMNNSNRNDADQKRVAEYIMHSKGKAKPSRSQTLDVVDNVQNSNTIDFINK